MKDDTAGTTQLASRVQYGEKFFHPHVDGPKLADVVIWQVVNQWAPPSSLPEAQINQDWHTCDQWFVSCLGCLNLSSKSVFLLITFFGRDVPRLKYLTNKYEWITDEKKYFGQVNTAYDFAATNPKEAGQQLTKLEERKTKLAKNDNMGAMSMFNKAEEQNDKSKITAVIRELDETKHEALLKAWQQVNQDFGSIFSTLLFGTQAKLVPPDGMSVLDGLGIERRSTLVGCVIPHFVDVALQTGSHLYILDEVDTALDLSHTQNIGQMLRTHFRHSQFIVVSLKDGMLNNANVLYKTTVTRFAQ
uniref:RecF/RecN/SMC N-terminal domain-containing protein n=1 Tax=Strigamia maritima TaxID=126957 RepID=T1IZW9_STRMM